MDNRTKEQIKEKNRKYYLKYREKIIEKNKTYYKNNIEKETIADKNYYEKNRDIILEKKKIYNKKNSEKQKQYRLEHNNNMKVYNSLYYKNRISKGDDLFKLNKNISSLIRISMRNGGYKKNAKTANILGCDFNEFKLYLESKFESWMNWSNYGNWNGIPKEKNVSWDIDHIIPVSSAKNEKELIKLNHYTNLQPLCSYYNRYIKRNEIR